MDHRSENVETRRGRPAVPAARILAAADALFADAAASGGVTMDAIAAAAGVGKGTLFRAFGSREGLLDALWTAKLTVQLDAMQAGGPPLGPGAPPRERIAALLDALLTFKLDNRHLIRARESASAELLRSRHYRWMHSLLRGLVDEAAPGTAAGYGSYCGHVLLAALHLDVIEDLLAAGLEPQAIRDAQAAHVRAIVDCARSG